MSDRTLTDADVDAIVDRLADRLTSSTEARIRPRSRLLTARELAAELNLERDYVYAHQVELGVMKMGTGPRARLRFDLEVARSALVERRPRPPQRAARR